MIELIAAHRPFMQVTKSTSNSLSIIFRLILKHERIYSVKNGERLDQKVPFMYAL